MVDRRVQTVPRESLSTASEGCFLCSRTIYPGQQTATFQGVDVHGRCFERDVLPDLEPANTSDS